MSSVFATLQTLETAEEFLEYFGIRYDQRVVDTCRLHILQRTHDYLAGDSLDGLDDDAVHDRVRAMLEQAYADFTASNPLTERVFKVLREAGERPADGGGAAFISLDDIAGVSRS